MQYICSMPVIVHVMALDINECTNGDNQCDQVCTNQNGSYSCSCNHGYVLLSDQRSCKGTIEHCCLSSFQLPKIQTSMSVKLIMGDVHKSALTPMDHMSVPVMTVMR